MNHGNNGPPFASPADKAMILRRQVGIFDVDRGMRRFYQDTLQTPVALPRPA